MGDADWAAAPRDYIGLPELYGFPRGLPYIAGARVDNSYVNSPLTSCYALLNVYAQ
jgi:hypothetical protein